MRNVASCVVQNKFKMNYETRVNQRDISYSDFSLRACSDSRFFFPSSCTALSLAISVTYPRQTKIFRKIELDRAKYQGLETRQGDVPPMPHSVHLLPPQGFGGQNPRRHPRSPRVYTYKNKEYLLKK